VIREGVAAGIALADIDEDGHLDLLANKETPDAPYLELLQGHGPKPNIDVGDATFTILPAVADLSLPDGTFSAVAGYDSASMMSLDIIDLPLNLESQTAARGWQAHSLGRDWFSASHP
jgi:hypothetical protein